MLQEIAKSKQKQHLVCKLIGHSWLFKDCTEWMQPDGNAFPYKRSRRCTRCSIKEISFHSTLNEWEIADGK